MKTNSKNIIHFSAVEQLVKIGKKKTFYWFRSDECVMIFHGTEEH